MKFSRPAAAAAAQKPAKAPGAAKPGRKPVAKMAKRVLQSPEEEEGEDSGQDADSTTGSEVNAGCNYLICFFASCWPCVRESLQEFLCRSWVELSCLSRLGVHSARCCV